LCERRAILIVGGGPAGIAAAIQLKRHGYAPLILEEEMVGGLVRNANLVENYPGFPDGIDGIALARLLAAHLDNAGIDAAVESVRSLDFVNSEFAAATSTRTVVSRVAVVATGTQPIKLNVSTLAPNAASRIHYEIFHLLPVSGKIIAVVGAGDLAFDYALNLGRSNRVVLLNRTDRVKALPDLQRRLFEHPAITYSPNTELTNVLPHPTGLSLECADRSGLRVLVVDHLVAAVGREPRLDFLSDRVWAQVAQLQEAGILYFVGDVAHPTERQAGIAVGDGLRAAMLIHQSFQKEKQCVS